MRISLAQSTAVLRSRTIAFNGLIIDLELTSACAAQDLPSWTIMGSNGSMTVHGSTAKLRYLKGKLAPMEVIDQPLVAGRKYGSSDGEKLEFIEEELEAKADIGPSFYDLLYKAIREQGEPPVDPATSRETLRVMFDSRKGTKFPG